MNYNKKHYIQDSTTDNITILLPICKECLENNPPNPEHYNITYQFIYKVRYGGRD